MTWPPSASVFWMQRQCGPLRPAACDSVRYRGLGTGGPAAVTAEGGMTGTYVKTTGKAGRGTLTPDHPPRRSR